jgi:Fe2+ or Zn2+ uptake regulation protein
VIIPDWYLARNSCQLSLCPHWKWCKIDWQVANDSQFFIAKRLQVTTMTFVERLTDISHKRGERMTNQRRLILETIESMPGHPSAEELFVRVKKADPGVHLSTIYRTLRWLEELGVISHRHFADARNLDRFDADPRLDHYHFRCRTCGRIFEFEQPLVEEIKTRFMAETHSEVVSAELILYGTCADCQAQTTE